MNSSKEQAVAVEQHNLGLQCVQKKDFSAAQQHFEKAIELDPSNPIYHNHLANVYKITKQFDLAEKYYLIAIQLNSDYAEAQHNLANLYASQNNFSLALKHYVNAVHLKPDYVEAHYHLGLLLLKEGKVEEAKVQFNNVIKLNPQILLAHYHLANICFSEEKYDEAKQHYEQVLELNSEHIDTLNNLGAIALKQEQSQLAIDYFTKVLALDEKNIEARSNIAATFLQYDRHENAIRHYKELLKAQPNDIDANFNMAVALMSLGHLTEALSFYEKILEIEPLHANTLSNLGVIYLRLGDREKANDYFQQAKKIEPNNPIVNYLLDAASQQQQFNKAPEEYVKNLFDHYALYYEKHLVAALNYKIPILIYDAVIAAAQQKNMQWRILDLGCGTGLSGEAIKPLAAQLVGIDLSAKMLEEAGKKNIYDELHLGDFTELLANKHKQYPSFDLIIAADVFDYIGDLDIAFDRCYSVLKSQGLFVFSIEKTDHYPFSLQPSARFAHSQQYIKELADKYLFKIESLESQVGRKQNEVEMLMDIVVLRK